TACRLLAPDFSLVYLRRQFIHLQSDKGSHGVMMGLCETRKFDRSNIGLWFVLLVAGMVLVTAACSKIKNDNTAVSTSGSGHSESTPCASTPSASAHASSEPGKPTPWEANADSLNGKDGETMTLACSPN